MCLIEGTFQYTRTYEIHQPHDGQYRRGNSPVNTKKVFFIKYDLWETRMERSPHQNMYSGLDPDRSPSEAAAEKNFLAVTSLKKTKSDGYFPPHTPKTNSRI